MEDIEERGLGNEFVDDECVVFLWVERQAHIEDDVGMAERVCNLKLLKKVHYLTLRMHHL